MKAFNRAKELCADQKGVSLVEILVAVAVGVIMIVGALSAIAPAIRISERSRHMQIAGALGKELADNITVMAEADWHAIDSLTTSTSAEENKYYVLATSSPFSIVSGTESVLVSTSTYTRYFYLQDAYRNGSGKIDTSGSYDPSTIKTVVVFSWPPDGATSSITTYLTRYRTKVFWQSDWSKGASTTVITATSVNAFFTTFSNIDFTTTTGAMRIDGI